MTRAEIDRRRTLSLLAIAGQITAHRLARQIVARCESRTNCVSCGCDIPPGRAGRRCAECRARNSTE